MFSILLLLLRDSSNFKIRIQAAAALAVPSSVLGESHLFINLIFNKQCVYVMVILLSSLVYAAFLTCWTFVIVWPHTMKHDPIRFC